MEVESFIFRLQLFTFIKFDSIQCVILYCFEESPIQRRHAVVCRCVDSIHEFLYSIYAQFIYVYLYIYSLFSLYYYILTIKSNTWSYVLAQ